MTEEIRQQVEALKAQLGDLDRKLARAAQVAIPGLVLAKAAVGIDAAATRVGKEVVALTRAIAAAQDRA